MAQPSSREGLIDYAKRQLGFPVLEINVADEQFQDLLDDAIQIYQERHYDGIVRMFLKYKITQDDIDRGQARGGDSTLGISTTTTTSTVGLSTTFDLEENNNYLQKEKNLKVKLGVAFNPYLKKYYKISSERERFERKISTGIIKSIWIQYGTDIKVLQNEFTYLKKIAKYEKLNLFGSLFIPSKQFIARFKFRPWKEVYISEKYLYALENFFDFTNDLVSFYKKNNITPLIESDFSSSEKLNSVYKFLKI